MTTDQAADWTLRALMALLTIWVFLWGKSAKQAEALLDAQLQIRDNRIAEILRRLDRAGQQSSDLTDKVQVLATREELQAEHKVRSEHIALLNVNLGKLQLDLVEMKSLVAEHGRRLNDPHHRP